MKLHVIRNVFCPILIQCSGCIFVNFNLSRYNSLDEQLRLPPYKNGPHTLTEWINPAANYTPIRVKNNPNSPNLWFNHKLNSILVNKGQIHGEIRDRKIFWNSIKSNDELRWEIRENNIFGKRTQKRIHGITRFGSRFTEKSMSELGRNFRTRNNKDPNLKD